MSEPSLLHQDSVFPFPPTPKFSNLTEVCKYLNDCGFDITWQAFHRTYSRYIKDTRSVIRGSMRAHGINTKIGDPSLHDKISMLIVKDMLNNSLRHILVEAIQQRAFANRIHVAQRLRQYALQVTPPRGTTRQQMMLAHLDAVLEAMFESLDSHHGGETNKGYLSRLYNESMRGSVTSVQVARHPESWFVVLGNQQDINLDVIVPRFARSYTALFRTFGSLLEEDKSDFHQLSSGLGQKKTIEAEVRQASRHRKASLIDAWAIINAKTKWEAAERSAKATRATRELVRVLKKQEAHKLHVASLADKGKTIRTAREIRDEMQQTLKEFGCSPRTEKQIYRACGELLEDLDHGLLSPDGFEESAFILVHDELASIARRSVTDALAHAAIMDSRVVEFFSDLFRVNRATFEKRRFDFAQHIARYMGSEPQSSEGLMCGIED